MRRLGVLMVLACGLAGCGPKPDGTGTGTGNGPKVEPTTPGGGSAASSEIAKLEGVWQPVLGEGPPNHSGPTPDEFSQMVLTVKGNLITGRRKVDPKPAYMVLEVDDKAKPKVITVTAANEKGEKTEPPHVFKGIYTVDGDTAKVALCFAPGAPPPADFTPKGPAKKPLDPTAQPGETAPTVVIHFAHQKELPDWAK